MKYVHQQDVILIILKMLNNNQLHLANYQIFQGGGPPSKLNHILIQETIIEIEFFILITSTD